MQAVYHADSETIAFAVTFHVRKHVVVLIRNGQALHSLELDTEPRLSLSSDGLLAVTTRSTRIFDLAEKRPNKAKSELESAWVFAEGGSELWSIAGPGTPVTDAALQPLTGLVAKQPADAVGRLVCGGVKGSALGLHVAGAGEFWVLADARGSQLILGAADRVTGTCRWNKGQQGEFPTELVVDVEHRRCFVRHDYFRFKQISRIDADGSIKSYRTESVLRSLPARVGDGWLFAVEEPVTGGKRQIGGVPVSLAILDPEAMTASPVQAPTPLPVVGDLTLVPLTSHSVALVRGKTDAPVVWSLVGESEAATPGAATSEAGAATSGVASDGAAAAELARLVAIYRTTAASFAQGPHPGSHAQAFESALGPDPVWTDCSQAVTFGWWPLFQHDEHQFVAMVPDWQREVIAWPIVAVDEEDTLEVTGVLDGRDRDLEPYLAGEVPADGVQAWDMFMSPWPVPVRDVASLARKALDAGDARDPIVSRWLEAIAAGTNATSASVMWQAAVALEEAGKPLLAVAMAHNALVGERLDAPLDPEHKLVLLRSAAVWGSATYRAWLGMVLPG